MKLSGTSAVVAGGTSGLGAATARALAGQGVSVVAFARNAPQREPEVSPRIEFAAGDVSDPDAVMAAMEQAAARAPLRCLVVCAGAADHRRTIGRDGRYESAHDLDSFRAVIETNVVGTFNCVRLAATAMSRNPAEADGQRGAMVLTSSVSAHDGQVGQAAYAASKAALHGLVLPIARDLAPAGIRINVLAPGAFDTPMYGPDGVDPGLRDRLNQAVVFPKRMGYAEEFAAAVLMLLTNDYLNGTVLRIDAGLRTLPR